MKRILCAVLLMLFCFSGIALAKSKTMVWKLSTIRPEGTAIDIDVKKFIEEVETKTDGRIKIQIYPNSQLGDYTIVQERIGVGSVDMSVQSVSTALDRQLQMMNMPYLVKNWDGIRNNYRTGSNFMNWFAKRMERQNIKFLAMWPSYFGGTALVKKPASPGDPSVKKGLKCRVMPQKSYELLGNSQGYMATPLALAETFTALQTGIVDGVFGAGAEGYYANYRDVIHYYIPSNTHVEAWPMLINMDIWNSLSKEDQAIVETAAKHFEDHRFEVGEADTAYNEKRLEDYGIEIIRLTDGEMEMCAEAGRKAIFPEMRKVIGPKKFDTIVELIKE